MPDKGFARIPDTSGFVLANATLPSALVEAPSLTVDGADLVVADIVIADGRIDDVIAIFEDNGCPIFNPHRYTLEEGGMKQTDAVQLAFKRESDPEGLLDPGKMIGCEHPDFDIGRSKVYLFAGLLTKP